MSIQQILSAPRELTITSVVDTPVPIGQTWYIKDIVTTSNDGTNDRGSDAGLSINGNYINIPSNSYRVGTNPPHTINGGLVLQAGDHISSDELPVDYLAAVETEYIPYFKIFYYIMEIDFGINLTVLPSTRFLTRTAEVTDTTGTDEVEDIITVPNDETWIITNAMAYGYADGGNTTNYTEAVASISSRPVLESNLVENYVNSEFSGPIFYGNCKTISGISNTIVVQGGEDITLRAYAQANNFGSSATRKTVKAQITLTYYIYELDFPQT